MMRMMNVNTVPAVTPQRYSQCRRVLLIALAVCGCVQVARLHAQPTTEAITSQTQSTYARAEQSLAARVRGLAARLEALQPTKPDDYLKLGEEVQAEAQTPEERALATRLLVLAIESERRLPIDTRKGSIGASACFALADQARSGGERRWLLALATSLAQTDAPESAPIAEGRTKTRATTRSAAAPSPTGDVGLKASTALALIRAGEGARARRVLSDPAVLEEIGRHERLMSPGELPGGLAKALRLAQESSLCTGCANRRFQKDGQGIRLCAVCNGAPGPHLADAEWVCWLRTELALINGVTRDWGAAVLVDAGEPLRDVDLAELGPSLNVDTERPIYRDGQWRKLTGWALSSSAAAPSKAPAQPSATKQAPGAVAPQSPKP